MTKIEYLEKFTTIDQCVAYLESIGCIWDYEKESQLQKDWRYVHENTLVVYDPYKSLSIDK